MFSNSKLLVSVTLLTIFLGFSLLWFGLKSEDKIKEQPTPTPLVEEAPIATSSSTLEVEGEKLVVTEVVDGDTIKLENGKTVRFIGIDTPETKDPRKPVQCFGKEASNETKTLLLNKMVILQKDVSETDKYGRLLRYIYLPLDSGETLFVNDYLVREGFARVLTYPPDVAFNEQLREAEKYARENNKGLWGRCN